MTILPTSSDIESRFGLDAAALHSVLEAALASGGDFAEVFLEYREYRSRIRISFSGRSMGRVWNRLESPS